MLAWPHPGNGCVNGCVLYCNNAFLNGLLSLALGLQDGCGCRASLYLHDYSYCLYRGAGRGAHDRNTNPRCDRNALHWPIGKGALTFRPVVLMAFLSDGIRPSAIRSGL